MSKPNRADINNYCEIESPKWIPGTTLLDVLDGGNYSGTWYGGVESVTLPSNNRDNPNWNSNQWFIHGRSLASETFVRAFALGVLLDGDLADSQIGNLISVAGALTLKTEVETTYTWAMPIVSRLDATPSDPDAGITITDYTVLPCNAYSIDDSSQRTYASIDHTAHIDNITGNYTDKSVLPIFVGWLTVFDLTSTAISVSMNGNICAHIYRNMIPVIDGQD